jgi:hypothetical protein
MPFPSAERDFPGSPHIDAERLHPTEEKLKAIAI